MSDIDHYELAAKELITSHPGYPLAWVTINLHKSNPQFWKSLASFLASSDEAEDDYKRGVACTKSCYASALASLSSKHPAILRSLAKSLANEGHKLKLPKASHVSIQQLLCDSGDSGANTWWRLLRYFVQSEKIPKSLAKQIFDFSMQEQESYWHAAEWFFALESGQKIHEIPDAVLYLALAHEVSETLRNLGGDIPWRSELYRLPISMRRLSSLGVLLLLPCGDELLKDGVICASHEILLSPLGDPGKGISEIYWRRPYHLYNDEMAHSLKRHYLDQTPANEIVQKVIEQGVMRIPHNEKPYLSKLISDNPERFYEAALSESELAGYVTMGLSAKTVAAHPGINKAMKTRLIKSDLDI